MEVLSKLPLFGKKLKKPVNMLNVWLYPQGEEILIKFFNFF
jgi:hypothetical protein